MADDVAESIRRAVAVACRAPSLHNSQPWCWDMSGGRLELRADGSRSLPVADPLGRQLVISCGTALHHLRVAAAAHGLEAYVDRLPEERDPTHLATVTFTQSPAQARGDSDETAVLGAAIPRRHTDRRAFAAPRSADVAGLGDRLPDRFGASLVLLDDDGPHRMAEAARQSAASRHHDPDYHAELYWWTGRLDPDQGVPASVLPVERAVPVEREFPVGTLASAPGPDRAALAVISTASDTRLDWLRSGEALSHVLLTATARGLATCPLTHVTEVARSRAEVAAAAAQAGETRGVPQIVIRLGTLRGADSDAPPATGRRPVAEVWRDREGGTGC